MINFNLGDLISKLNVASRGHLKSVFVNNNKLTLNVLTILYKNGIIDYFKVSSDRKIIVYLKYFQNRSIFSQIVLVSKPRKRVYWSLTKLSLMCSKHSFCQLYIILLQKV